MKKLVTITGMAALAAMVAACGSSATSTPPATTPSAATSAAGQSAAATAAATASPSSAAASSPSSAAVSASVPASASASASAAAAVTLMPATSPTGWCGELAQTGTYSSLSTWLNSAGYSDVQSVEAVLSNLKAPNVPAATVQQYGGGLCTSVADSEGIPAPVDQTDFNIAMTDLMKASSYLHVATSAAQAEAAPFVSAGSTALDNFLKAIGKPATS